MPTNMLSTMLSQRLRLRRQPQRQMPLSPERRKWLSPSFKSKDHKNRFVVMVAVMTVCCILLHYVADNKLPREHHRVKNILYFNSFWGVHDFNFGIGQEPFLMNQCPSTNCYITSNRTHLPNLSDFDAILFFMIDFPALEVVDNVRRQKGPHQRFIMFQPEPPSIEQNQVDYTKLKGFFDWTMTYRQDSDIPRKYGWLTTLNDEPTTKLEMETRYKKWKRQKGSYLNSLQHLARRPKGVAWIVSNCITPSRREDYVRELQNHIPVQVFGSCLQFNSMTCSTSYGPDAIELDNCSMAVKRDYKFYLSFENSFCNDYLTEKFFLRLQHDSLPVVLGQGTENLAIPPHSYINVLDYDSPKDLASYLHKLSEDDDLYLSYFWWKQYYKVHVGTTRANHARSFCKICEKLNNPREPEKHNDDIFQWWIGDAQCDLVRDKALKGVYYNAYDDDDDD